jgi:enolase-phosphatase E1
MQTSAVLLDIEGTTTSISFVTDTLFPYARRRGHEFIASHLEDPELQSALDQLREENITDQPGGAPLIENNSPEQFVESVTAYYLWLMDRDRKSTPLKTIQGRIWQEGYSSGDLHSEIFSDVPEAFRRWREQGVTIAIYSSGSVLAQQQLFRHTSYGDLTPHIAAYFDTRVGNKKESASYRAITAALNVPGDRVVFVSDAIAELDAADEAGLTAVLSMRPGNSVQETSRYKKIHSFDALFSVAAPQT